MFGEILQRFVLNVAINSSCIPLIKPWAEKRGLVDLPELNFG
jgi:hypothetical protein